MQHGLLPKRCGVKFNQLSADGSRKDLHHAAVTRYGLLLLNADLQNIRMTLYAKYELDLLLCTQACI